MSAKTFDILPPYIKEPLGAIAKAMECDPETAVAAWLAFDEIKRLPDREQAKAIAIVVQLRQLAGDIGA
jgi:hypothetical protein